MNTINKVAVFCWTSTISVAIFSIFLPLLFPSLSHEHYSLNLAILFSLLNYLLTLILSLPFITLAGLLDKSDIADMKVKGIIFAAVYGTWLLLYESIKNKFLYIEEGTALAIILFIVVINIVSELSFCAMIPLKNYFKHARINR